MQSRQNKDEIIDEIFGLYAKYGGEDYIGEPVSQLEHMSQSAQLAVQEGYDDEVVLAAFFHDIGHICVQKNGENDMGGVWCDAPRTNWICLPQRKGFFRKDCQAGRKSCPGQTVPHLYLS